MKGHAHICAVMTMSFTVTADSATWKGLVQSRRLVGDFDSYDDPHLDVETITLPVAKDDTDTVYAMREGMKRGCKEFLLLGAIGSRLDHTLVNAYILTSLENRGCHGIIIDDHSEIEIVSSRAEVDDSYPFFSLVAMEGDARGVTIRKAKFENREKR